MSALQSSSRPLKRAIHLEGVPLELPYNVLEVDLAEIIGMLDHLDQAKMPQRRRTGLTSGMSTMSASSPCFSRSKAAHSNDIQRSLSSPPPSPRSNYEDIIIRINEPQSPSSPLPGRSNKRSFTDIQSVDEQGGGGYRRKKVKKSAKLRRAKKKQMKNGVQVALEQKARTSENEGSSMGLHGLDALGGSNEGKSGLNVGEKETMRHVTSYEGTVS
jgi:hypothetical protein